MSEVRARVRKHPEMRTLWQVETPGWGIPSWYVTHEKAISRAHCRVRRISRWIAAGDPRGRKWPWA